MKARLISRVLPLLTISFLTLCFSLQSCHKESVDKTPKQIFTVHRDDNYESPNLEHWVILHDKNGILLGYQSFAESNDLVFESASSIPDNVITVTQIWASLNHYNCATYFLIPVGSTLNFNIGNHTGQGTDIGSFDITVQDPPSLSGFQVTTSTGNSSYHFEIDNDAHVTSSVYLGETRYLLALADHEDNLSYKIFDNVQPDGTYTIAYSDMDKFDKTVHINFPQSDDYYLAINAWEDGQFPGERTGYSLRNAYSSSNIFRNSISCGYADRFNRSITQFRATVGNVTYGYWNTTGAPTSDITITAHPHPFNIQDSTIQRFHLTSDVPFGLRYSSWITREGDVPWTAWSVFAPDGTQQYNIELPAEITARYPALVFNGLYYKASTIYINTRSYTDIMQEYLSTGAVNISDEFQTLYELHY